MPHPIPDMHDDKTEAERHAMQAAVDLAEADPRRVPHEEVRAWLHRLAAGEFDAAPPHPR